MTPQNFIKGKIVNYKFVYLLIKFNLGQKSLYNLKPNYK